MKTPFSKLIANTSGKLLLSALTLQLSLTGCVDVENQSARIFEEVDGLVAVEAEHYSGQRFDEVRQWKLMNAENLPLDTAGDIMESASGNAYMQILPDTRVTHDDQLIVGEN